MGPINGFELMTTLSDRGIRWPIIVMTAHADIPTAVRATKLGAIDFLKKPLEINLLKASVHAAMARMSVVRYEDEIQSTIQELFAALTQRELDVVTGLTDGLSNKIVAHKLSISVRTVEMHRANALRKLKVKSIAEVIGLANDADVVLGTSHCQTPVP